MRKVFLAYACIGTMIFTCSQCTQEDTIEVNRQAIAFGNAFVDNATRALNDDYSGTKKLESFKVYGTVTGSSNTVNLFSDVQINRNNKNFGEAWDYADESKKQYWVPSCEYNFAAIVDGTVATATSDGMPATISYKLGDGDLLYATARTNTDETGNPTNLTNGIVAFTFNHLLSKVYFTFTDGLGTGSDYKYDVSEIKVNGIHSEGTYTIDGGTWALGTSTVAEADALNFGIIDEKGVSAEDHLIIPGYQTMRIQFSYNVLFKDNVISTIQVDKTLIHDFAQGTMYNITAELPALGNEIKFTVTANPGEFTAATGTPNINL